MPHRNENVSATYIYNSKLEILVVMYHLPGTVTVYLVCAICLFIPSFSITTYLNIVWVLLLAVIVKKVNTTLLS